MIKNSLRVAFRSLWKNKGYSFINIVGLATGIACSLLIFLFVNHETSYDGFNKDAANIYRVVKDFVNDDGSRLPDATSPAALAPAMQKEIPGVAAVTRLRPNWGQKYLVKYEEKSFTEEKVYRVDSSFFDVFTIRFSKGDPKNAFKEINSVLITEQTAKKYFGNADPMGKIIQIETLGDLMVTGVLKDIPANAHFHFDFLASYRKLKGNLDANWGGYNDYTYVKVNPGTNIKNFIASIQSLYKRNDPGKATNIFWVQALRDIHLTSNLKWELAPNGDKLYVYVFTVIGLFIILIAAINYVNLATAKAAIRAKEVGVRKVAGAGRRSLIGQFLVESVITCLIAAALALVMAIALVPFVNDITGKQLRIFADPSLMLYLLSAALVLGITAGFFPAMYLSSFKPIAVLKDFKLKENRTLSLRKALVVVQFTISIVLIIGAMVISQQMNFVQSAKLGLSTDQVIVINDGRRISTDHKNAFYNKLSQVPGVKKMALSSGMVGGLNSTSKMNARGSTNEQLINYITVGYDFFDVLDIKFREGRGFSRQFPADTLNNGTPGPLDQTIGSIVLNETAVKDLGIGFPAVGKQLLWGTDADTMYYVNIIGVTQDFHFTSLRNKIKPFAFIHVPGQLGTFVVKLSSKNIAGTLAQLENQWDAVSPEKPFEYTFLDETFSRLYQAETRFHKVFISLVALGVLIACLGLLGLAMFAAQQRVKEIGIRKVLGASTAGIAKLLSKDFIKLVVIAFVLATPVALFAVNKWLQDFAYRIEVKWWVFPLAWIVAIFIAILTISFQAVKAAMANPVKSLRTE